MEPGSCAALPLREDEPSAAAAASTTAGGTNEEMGPEGAGCPGRQAGGTEVPHPRGATGSAWIPWQVPSPVVLAAAPPSAQRAIKDALVRTLAANSMRMDPRQIGAFLALPQPEVLSALQGGPEGTGSGAAALRAAVRPLGRRPGSALGLRRL